MVDLSSFVAVFAELEDLAASEPELAEFVPAAEELHRQAAALAAGATQLPEIPPTRAVMPRRDLADRIVRVVSRLPPVDEGAAPDLQLRVAQLVGNLVNGVTGPIFARYPEAIPREGKP
ncbi:MAG: hypothetical protein IT377_30505 [Polyangiaceae bacterium]|nr:hypothetical protein [Polyangiaceae bacterium]